MGISGARPTPESAEGGAHAHGKPGGILPPFCRGGYKTGGHCQAEASPPGGSPGAEMRRLQQLLSWLLLLSLKASDRSPVTCRGLGYVS